MNGRRNMILSSLRVLGTVGEPINPEAWMWYYNDIGHGRCPIVDTWWQTETGGHFITPLPGVNHVETRQREPPILWRGTGRAARRRRRVHAE